MNLNATPHIAIIGGGFSGTMTLVNLVRLCEVPLKITLINHGYPQGRGVAYSTRRPEHLLNVAARNMSALPEHPNHFVDWLRTRTEYVDLPDAELRETFIPRRLYGDYVRSLALHYAQPLARHSNVQTTFVDDEAVDIVSTAEGACIKTASGRSIQADKVVLATGNEMPAEIPGANTLGKHAGYAANPWQDWTAHLPPATESIVLLGTGLTTVDAIVTLLALDWKGTIYAVSRNGLLPQSHFKGVDFPEFPPADVDIAQLGLDRLVAIVERYCARLRAIGQSPAIVVDRMRPHTQRIWQALTLEERRVFVAKYAAQWNVIRHRIAPAIHQSVKSAIESGRLRIVTGSIDRLEAHGSQIRVNLGGRTGSGSSAGNHIDGALVVNCTGPQTRFSATRSTLLRALLAGGVAQPDEMDMGIRIDENFAAIERGGGTSPFLRVLGPLLRGTFWESIAVPELRGQALQVAEILLDELVLYHTHPSGADHEPAVIEYWI